MAVYFDEKESLPPSHLLTDDDGVSENQNINRNGSSTTESIQTGFGSWGSSSDLSTPFESELDSTETDSDEDDFIGELTRQMADYMLQEDDENTTPNSVSAKPKWSDNCDLGSTNHHGQRLMSSNSPPKPVSIPAHVKNPNVGVYSNDQIQAIQFYDQLENQQLIKNQGSACWERRGKMTESTQQLQHQKQQYMINRGIIACGFGNGGRVGPTPQQQAGSGMRAIFLGGSDSRSRSSGTGVFLPRGTGNPQESRKKRGCSTVLIPARVMQALKLHFDDMNALSPSSGCGALTAYHLQRDAVTVRSNDMHSEQKRHSQSQLRPPVDNHEMDLPQEWTY